MSTGIILVEFSEDGKASFEVKTQDDGQIFTALLGLEAYIASKIGLPIADIRDIMDDIRDTKQVVEVKAIDLEV